MGSKNYLVLLVQRGVTRVPWVMQSSSKKPLVSDRPGTEGVSDLRCGMFYA